MAATTSRTKKIIPPFTSLADPSITYAYKRPTKFIRSTILENQLSLLLRKDFFTDQGLYAFVFPPIDPKLLTYVGDFHSYPGTVPANDPRAWLNRVHLGSVGKYYDNLQKHGISFDGIEYDTIKPVYPTNISATSKGIRQISTNPDLYIQFSPQLVPKDIIQNELLNNDYYCGDQPREWANAYQRGAAGNYDKCKARYLHPPGESKLLPPPIITNLSSLPTAGSRDPNDLVKRYEISRANLSHFQQRIADLKKEIDVEFANRINTDEYDFRAFTSHEVDLLQQQVKASERYDKIKKALQQKI